MKLSLSIIVLLASCSLQTETVSDIADQEFSELKSPVILIATDEDSFGWKITVKDSTGKVMSFGNQQIIANTIGHSRHIGDTLK